MENGDGERREAPRDPETTELSCILLLAYQTLDADQTISLSLGSLDNSDGDGDPDKF
jgi:hypothetical protein